jgi:hypothetical protein
MKVQVYYNLHKKRLSVRSTRSGLVVNHAKLVKLNNAQFRVQPAGQHKVRRDGRKNVHAYVAGELAPKQNRGYDTIALESLDQAFYNPYKNDFFVNSKGEELRGKYETVYIIGKEVFYK